MPLIGLSPCNKDLRVRHLDHGGNEFSLAAWLARAMKSCSAQVVTEIIAGRIILQGGF